MASSPTAGPPGQPARRPDDEQASGAGFQRAIARINRNVAGWVLVAFGLLAIFLGWFGVSGQALMANQLP